MLITENLFIRLPVPDDAKLLNQFEEKNREHLKRWSTTGELTTSTTQWPKRITNWIEEYNQEKAVRFLLFLKEKKKVMLGMCNFTNIIRGPLQACYLGYKIDAEFINKGLITEALETTISFMFNHYNLHRIMANYQPSNLASGRVLKKLGFRVEGYAYDYLLTDHGWQDHILASLINNEWQEKH